MRLRFFNQPPAPDQSPKPTFVDEFEQHGTTKYLLDGGGHIHISREDDTYFATWPTNTTPAEVIDISSVVLGLPREDQQGLLLTEPSLSPLKGSARYIAQVAMEHYPDERYLRLFQLEYDGKREMLSWESRYDAWLGRKAIEAGFLFKNDKKDHFLELVYRTSPADVRAQAVDAAKLLIR